MTLLRYMYVTYSNVIQLHLDDVQCTAFTALHAALPHQGLIEQQCSLSLTVQEIKCATQLHMRFGVLLVL